MILHCTSFDSPLRFFSAISRMAWAELEGLSIYYYSSSQEQLAGQHTTERKDRIEDWCINLLQLLDLFLYYFFFFVFLFYVASS